MRTLENNMHLFCLCFRATAQPCAAGHLGITREPVSRTWRWS